MLFIEEQDVYLTRGDDANLEFALTRADGVDYVMDSNDRLIFSIRELPSVESEILATIPSAYGSNVIVIRHEDTAELDVGRYSADCQLVTATGNIFTVWPELDGRTRYKERNFKNFILMPEVTMP